LLIDSFNRPITYLRISITDRCNLRCVYCMPPEGVPFQPHETVLRYEEIAALARILAGQGVRAIRLTGGEPLVRRGVQDLVKMLAEIPGIEDISLTTNGILLEELARPLAEAGLKRINVSLDTLLPQRFAEITRGGSIQKVWDGIAAAEAQGICPVKINVVAMRGVNDDELVDMARLTLEHTWHVRFIELMPVKNQMPWGPGFPAPEDAYISVQEMHARLSSLGLEAVERSSGSGPARLYRARGAQGLIGFISPVGEHFCDTCNRLRLTADGSLRPCLLSDVEIPLRDALRAGEDVRPLVLKALNAKPAGHRLALDQAPNGRCMRQIGG
jgi:cyclic pyranopterin phosphate synthase